MTKDSDILKNTWEKNSQIIAESSLSNKKVVYLTVGDPYLYSTWIYLHRELSKKHPEIKITVIPGIVSMFTFASKVGISLAEGAEKIKKEFSKIKENIVKEISVDEFVRVLPAGESHIVESGLGEQSSE